MPRAGLRNVKTSRRRENLGLVQHAGKRGGEALRETVDHRKHSAKARRIDHGKRPLLRTRADARTSSSTVVMARRSELARNVGKLEPADSPSASGRHLRQVAAMHHRPDRCGRPPNCTFRSSGLELSVCVELLPSTAGRVRRHVDRRVAWPFGFAVRAVQFSTGGGTGPAQLDETARHPLCDCVLNHASTSASLYVHQARWR